MRSFSIISLLGILLYSSSIGQSQNFSSIESKDLIENSFKNFVSENPTNRLFLHFDKEDYTASESMWFKAYLYDGYLKRLDTIPANLYVQMFSFEGKAVASHLFIIENGFAIGEIKLDKDLPDGNYFIKAYTDIMANSFVENSFTHNFYLNNPDYANRVSRKEIRYNKQFNQKLDEKRRSLALSAHPEGGRLVANIANKLIVKTRNGIGEALGGDGILMDGSKQVIGQFNINQFGIGVIEFIPEPNVDYSIEFSHNNLRQVVSLPKVVSNGVVVRVKPTYSDSVIINMYSTLPNLNVTTLAVRLGADLLYHKIVPLNQNEWVEVPLVCTDLETGVVMLEVYSKDLGLISQRPIYVNKNNETYIHPAIEVLQIDQNRVVSLTLKTTNTGDQPIESNMSIAVTAGVEKTIKSNDIYRHINISSYFTDLEYIPSDLLAIDDNNMLELLDMLILTGTYKIPSLFQMAEHIRSNDTPERKLGVSVKGMVIDPYTNQPVSDVAVELRHSFGDKTTYRTKTNKSGVFVFDGVDVNDSSKVEISSSLISGGVRPTIKLISDEEKTIDYQYSPKTVPQKIINRGDSWSRPKSASVHSSVSASPYGRPDQTIFINTRMAHRTVYEVLQERAIGLIIAGTTVMFRGPSSILQSNEPLFIRDDVVVSSEEFLDRDPRDVERIELFRGASAAFWGARGGNGVILSYGKRGEAPVSPYSEFVLKGFASPGIFSVDPIAIFEEHSRGIQQTVLWEPNLIASESGIVNVNFLFIPGITGYNLEIVGVSSDGKIVMGNFSIGK